MKTATPTFHSRLLSLRERAGLSQSETARRADLSRNYYRRVESGSAVPTWTVVLRLASVLGVGVEQFAR